MMGTQTMGMDAIITARLNVATRAVLMTALPLQFVGLCVGMELCQTLRNVIPDQWSQPHKIQVVMAVVRFAESRWVGLATKLRWPVC